MTSSDHGAFLSWTLANASSGTPAKEIALPPHASAIDTGILLFDPPDATEQLIVSAGIHGNETAPVELLDNLATEIISGALQPKVRLLLILGNPAALTAQSRFLEVNLNRLFGPELPSPATSLEAARAGVIREAVERFLTDETTAPLPTTHYDLHTAIRGSIHNRFALSPHVDRPGQLAANQIDFLRRSDIDAILLGNAASTTFSWFTANLFGAQSLTIELGAVRPFGQNDLGPLGPITAALKQQVQALAPKSTERRSDPRFYRVIGEVLRHSADEFELHLTFGTPNFSELPIGHQLTSDSDGGYTTPSRGLRVVFPNASVTVGQRCAVIVEGIDRPKDEQTMEAL